MKKQLITTLLIEPGKHPISAYLEPTEEYFNRSVSIGSYDPGKAKAKEIDNGIYVVFNRNSFISGLEGNRTINGEIIAGIFYIVATNSSNHLRSLTDSELQKYRSIFWEPEIFSDIDVVETNLNSLFKALDELE